MPRYDYDHDTESECPDFETFQKMGDKPLELCPSCGMPVHRLLSIPRVQFRGSAEDPNASVRRILGTKRDEQTFDCPWPNEQGETESIRLSGSKAERKAQVQDCILRTKNAKRRNLTRSDIDVPNL